MCKATLLDTEGCVLTVIAVKEGDAILADAPKPALAGKVFVGWELVSYDISSVSCIWGDCTFRTVAE